MDFIKMLLIALGLVILGMVAFSVFGLVYSVLWYVLFFSVIGIAGYGAYKWLTDGNETAKLEGKKTIAIGDVTNYKRALKEYVKRK
jgi:hypothetical protein